MLRMSSAIEDARKKIISTKKTIRTRGLKMIDGILRGSNGACASDCGDAWSSVVSALLEKKQSLAEDSETLKVFRRVIRVAHETASGSLRKFSKEIWEIGIVVLLEFRGGGRGSTDDTFSLLEASKIMSFMLEHPAYALILPIQNIKQILKRYVARNVRPPPPATLPPLSVLDLQKSRRPPDTLSQYRCTRASAHNDVASPRKYECKD